MKTAEIMSIEYFGEVSIYFGLGVQIVTALFLGGLVGFDREVKLKSAGIKTNILICIGATLYTSIGLILSTNASGPSDPARMAAQIVSGIGFLGAGAIIQSRGNVTGMTTAAMIWVVAAIGFTVGAGYPFTASIFTVTVLASLTLLKPIYSLLEREKYYSLFHLEVLSIGPAMKAIDSILDTNGVDVEAIQEDQHHGKKGEKITNLYVNAHQRQVERLAYDFRQALRVKDVAFYQVNELPKDLDEDADSALIASQDNSNVESIVPTKKKRKKVK